MHALMEDQPIHLILPIAHYAQSVLGAGAMGSALARDLCEHDDVQRVQVCEARPAMLRAFRASVAGGKPPYTVFTNETMARNAARPPADRDDRVRCQNVSVGKVGVIGDEIARCLGLGAGIGHGQRGVHVRASGLGPGRDGVVRQPPPTGNAHAEALAQIEVLAQRVGPHGKLGDGLLKIRRNVQAGLVERRADVDVGCRPVALHQFGGNGDQLVQRMLGREIKNLAVAQDALVMLPHPENAHGVLLRQVVAANALEQRRAVEKRMGLHADLGVIQRDEGAFKIHGLACGARLVLRRTIRRLNR